MISTYMAEYFLLARIVLAIGFAVAVAASILLARRDAGGRRVATVIAVIAAILVLALTLSPDPTGVQSEIVCNLTPRSFAADVLNMALFLLPALFAVVASHRAVLVAVAVPVTSAVIELVQFLTPAFGRRCDVDDWIANLIGGLVGVVIGLVALRLARRSRGTGKPR